MPVEDPAIRLTLRTHTRRQGHELLQISTTDAAGTELEHTHSRWHRSMRNSWVRSRARPEIAQRGRIVMLYYTMTFLVVALIAAILGFGGIAGMAAGIAKILFFIFLVLFLITLITGRHRGV